jgi:uncharacterized protein (TIGR03086 family)
MSETHGTPDLSPAADQLKAIAAGVGDDHLALLTPCAPWTVGDLLDHVMGLALAFRLAAEKSFGPGGSRAPADPSRANLDPDWRRELPARVDAMAAAWRDPAAWDGMTEVGGVRLPAEAIGAFGLDELVMHGWDLARATGQSFAADPGNTAVVTGLLSQLGPEVRAGGGFGQVVPVDADVAPLDRALALAGRDPRWSADGHR